MLKPATTTIRTCPVGIEKASVLHRFVAPEMSSFTARQFVRAAAGLNDVLYSVKNVSFASPQAPPPTRLDVTTKLAVPAAAFVIVMVSNGTAVPTPERAPQVTTRL